jgi:hypothetical protein
MPQARPAHLPGSDLGQKSHANTAHHPAESRAADIEAHRPAEMLGLNFLGEVGHGDCWHPAEDHAGQGAGGQQNMPVRRDCGENGEQCRQAHRDEHQPAPSQSLRARAGDDDGKGEQASRE